MKFESGSVIKNSSCSSWEDGVEWAENHTSAELSYHWHGTVGALPNTTKVSRLVAELHVSAHGF